MKYLKEIAIILSVTFIGETLNLFLPFPIPASMYGLVLMLILLGTKTLKVHQVRTTADFLIETMPVMFIPAGVGLIGSWKNLKEIYLPVLVIILITTILVMGVTGKTADILLNQKEKNTK